MTNNYFLKYSQNLPEVEEQVLADWKVKNTFNETLKKSNNCKTWVFYDGPPFANGLPHYGHLLTGYVKDTLPRLKTMQGYNVPRVFGWDTHGLPAELEAMKVLGLTQRTEVEKLGVHAFNKTARTSVMKYVDEWEDYVERQGRWVDFEGGYKTLDIKYMESELWAFKELYNKGLLYQGYKVVPYCVNDGTALSNHELNMDGETYKRKVDTSAVVSFELKEPLFKESSKTYLLAWTTTPWTLPMNTAVAVNPELMYVMFSLGESTYVCAENQLENVTSKLKQNLSLPEGNEAKILEKFKGDKLQDVKYLPLFSNTAEQKDFKHDLVVLADFVTSDQGTGLVHLAPAHGEDDFVTSQKENLLVADFVDAQGKYNNSAPDFLKNKYALDSNNSVVNYLNQENKLAYTEKYEHNYPHCWRCGNPLMYKALTNWFLKTTVIRDEMVELNKEINWTPDYVGNKMFHNWLSNTQDWCVSRNRFWGTPLPVWVSDNSEYPRVDVYGSQKELEEAFNVQLDDLHRDVLDELTRPNPDDPSGVSMMRRVPEVLDVWFDSSVMPFAQMHYPFENKKEFHANHPADFVVEYTGQVRGWFYVMHVMSTALFGSPAFKNVMSHGVLLGDDGQKMSKSKGNYPDVNELMNTYGSDALRWHFLSSPVLQGRTAAVSEDEVKQSANQVQRPLWNTLTFYNLYVKSEDATLRTEGYTHPLDVYLMDELTLLVNNMNDAWDRYDTVEACRQATQFMEMLNNWYVRLSRKRVWADNKDTQDVLYTVLNTILRLLAPLLPMTVEAAWKELNPEQLSVHMQNYPTKKTSDAEASMNERLYLMNKVKKIVSSGLTVRKRNGVKLRQPLNLLQVKLNNHRKYYPYLDLVKEELNVKEVELAEPATQEVEVEVKLNARQVGKAFGKDTQKLFKSVKEGDWELKEDKTLQVNNFNLSSDMFELLKRSKLKDNEELLSSDNEKLSFNLELTQQLLREGEGREFLRALQELRKEFNFDVHDRVQVDLFFETEESKSRFLTSWNSKWSEDLLAVNFDTHANLAPKKARPLNSLPQSMNKTYGKVYGLMALQKK